MSFHTEYEMRADGPEYNRRWAGDRWCWDQMARMWIIDFVVFDDGWVQTIHEEPTNQYEQMTYCDDPPSTGGGGGGGGGGGPTVEPAGWQQEEHYYYDVYSWTYSDPYYYCRCWAEVYQTYADVYMNGYDGYGNWQWSYYMYSYHVGETWYWQQD